MGFRAGLKALAQRIGLVKKDEKVEEVVEEGLVYSARAPSLAPAPSAPLSASQAHIEPTSQPPCRNRWYRARAPPGLKGPKIHVHRGGLLVPWGEFAQAASAARRSPSALCTRVTKRLDVGHACLMRWRASARETRMHDVQTFCDACAKRRWRPPCCRSRLGKLTPWHQQSSTAHVNLWPLVPWWGSCSVPTVSARGWRLGVSVRLTG